MKYLIAAGLLLTFWVPLMVWVDKCAETIYKRNYGQRYYLHFYNSPIHKLTEQFLPSTYEIGFIIPYLWTVPPGILLLIIAAAFEAGKHLRWDQ